MPGVTWEDIRRILAGQPRDQICPVLTAAARHAFDLLEPSLGSHGIKTCPDRPSQTPQPHRYGWHAKRYVSRAE